MTKALLALFAGLTLAGCIIVVNDDGNARPDLDYELRTLALDASDLQRLVADTGAGSLEIIGEDQRSEIEVVAEVHYGNVEDIVLTLERSGDAARLDAHMRNDRRYGGWSHIDLLLRVPATLDLDLKDGSGEISITGLRGKVLVEDGSGSLRLDGAATATIKDGSGSLEVENIEGDLFVEDGSGAVHIRHVGGVVTIEDGSGEIDIRDAGSLNLLETGSGGLRLQDVRGNVSQH